VRRKPNLDITIIIPTMGACPEILSENIIRLLNEGCSVHLIDNSPTNVCKHYEKMGIKMSYFPSNLGVNLAWNIGVASADTKHYMLLNDDCLIWNNVGKVTMEILENPRLGLVTFRTLVHINQSIYDSMFMDQWMKPYNIEYMGPSQREQKMGWLIAGRTDEYVMIPKQLKILFGDDFLYSSIRKKKLYTVVELGNPVLHRVSHTIFSRYTNAEYALLYKREERIYQMIAEQYKLGGV